MKFKDFVSRDAVIPSLASTDRDSAIREVVDALVKAGSIAKADADDIVKSLINREKSGSTGFGRGVAVPHVKHRKIKKMVGAFARSETGIDFRSLDGKPVHSIFLLLSPEDQPAQHLDAMNVVFTWLQNDTFRNFLRQSGTRQLILDLIEEADTGASLGKGRA